MIHSNDLRFDRKRFLGLLLLGLASVPSLARADAARTVAAHLRRHCESFAPPLASSAGSRWQTSRVT